MNDQKNTLVALMLSGLVLLAWLYFFGQPQMQQRQEAQKQQQQAQNQASSNVYNLQKKVSGVLPVRIDVPRAGNSYHFARALVLDEETKLTFNYKSELKIAKK